MLKPALQPGLTSAVNPWAGGSGALSPHNWLHLMRSHTGQVRQHKKIPSPYNSYFISYINVICIQRTFYCFQFSTTAYVFYSHILYHANVKISCVKIDIRPPALHPWQLCTGVPQCPQRRESVFGVVSTVCMVRCVCVCVNGAIGCLV